MSNAEAIQPAVGAIIDNKYRVDCLIGQGGMGRVFRVTHIQLNKVFALKLMSAGNPKRLPRFRREAEALAKINHPNVVMVTDFGVTPDDAPYIVMEYIEGMTLRKYIKTKGTLSEKEAIKIGKQVCAGLHEAHANNIIHRDLKPDNIMIQWLSDGDAMVRVVDFGLAKLNEPTGSSNGNLTEDRDLPGTIRYMAPEQLCRMPVDQRTDIFSFCLILYEILTGNVPHVVVSKAKPITDLRTDISTRFSDMVLKGLCQDANDRQQSALDIKRELESLELALVLPSGATSGVNRLAELNPVDSAEIRSAETAINQQNKTNTGPLSNITNLEGSAPRRYWVVGLAGIILLVIGLAVWAIYPEVTKKIDILKNSDNGLSESAIPPMIKIKGSKYRMGVNKGDEFAQPEHEIVIEPFRVSRFLVTNRQYSEFITRTNNRPPKHWIGNTPPPEILEKPVTNVSNSDARAYCTWLSNQTKEQYRLITEQEWEYMASNRAELGVDEINGDHAEWTGSKFYLYPGSKIKPPKLSEYTYILRGRSHDKVAIGQDPRTFRLWQISDYVYDNLGFRIASNQ